MEAPTAGEVDLHGTQMQQLREGDGDIMSEGRRETCAPSVAVTICRGVRIIYSY